MTDEERQRLLDNTLVGTSRRLNETARQLVHACLREWGTFVAVAIIVLTITLAWYYRIGFP